MRKIISLCRLYILSVYSLPTRRNAEGTSALNRKAVIKAIGIAFLFLYIIAGFGSMLVFLNISMYGSLKPVGMEGLLSLSAVMSAFMLTLVFGFITALSTYFISGSETQLLSLPLKPRELFAPKFGMTYLSEAVFSLFIIGIYLVVFGIMEGPGPLFYLYGVILALFVPLIPLVLSYLIIIPLMSFGKGFRNKDALMIAGGILGVGFAVGFQLVYQRLILHASDPAYFVEAFSEGGGILYRLRRVFPPAAWASEALSDYAGGRGLLSLLLFVGVSAASVFFLVRLFSPLYRRSLVGFNEASLKRLKDSRSFIRSSFSSGGKLRGLFLRELRLMNREPVYFFNGPFVLFLLPVIFGVMIFVQRETFLPLLEGLSGLDPYYLGLIASGVGAFMGSSMSIASTALSREGAQLSFIKSLPIEPGEFFGAKILHSLVFSAFGSLLGAGGLSLAFGLSALGVFFSVLLSLSFCFLTGILGLFIDTAHPKLTWTSPTAAMKQNMNATAAVLGTMALIAALGFLFFLIPAGKAVIPLAAAALIGLSLCVFILFVRFARKRYYELEV